MTRCEETVFISFETRWAQSYAIIIEFVIELYLVIFITRD